MKFETFGIGITVMRWELWWGTGGCGADIVEGTWEWG